MTKRLRKKLGRKEFDPLLALQKALVASPWLQRKSSLRAALEEWLRAHPEQAAVLQSLRVL
jgi:hypothetical protein